MNKEFQWTDELVKEMIYKKSYIPEQYFGSVQKMLDDFKASKEIKEPDRIEVKFVYLGGSNTGFYFYNEFCTNEEIPKQKEEAIKQAIEQVLNGDMSGLKSFPEAKAEFDKNNPRPRYKVPDEFKQKLYTEKEKIEAEKLAFYAGRERIGAWWNEQIKNWEYKTFENYCDYNISLKAHFERTKK